MKTLSIQRPLPSMEIFTPASFRTCVKARLVNWLSEGEEAALAAPAWAGFDEG